MKEGDKVLDLGCYPGGWSSFALKIVGERGLVVGVDIKKTENVGENFTFIEGDIALGETMNDVKRVCKNFDVILSDVSPKISGIRERDITLHERIVEAVFRYSELLREGGRMVLKLFEYGDFVPRVKSRGLKIFKLVKVVKPPASRKSSSEVYLVFLKKAGGGI